jgi:hypothetical protein
LVLASLTVVISPPPAPVASTYDEAACAEAARVEPRALHDDDGVDCSNPEDLVSAPAVVDCNDQRASRWVGEMIGSCDMPRPLGPSALLVVRAPGAPGAPRICDGIRCVSDSSPLRPASRAPDPNPYALAGSLQLQLHLVCSPLVEESLLRPCQAARDRLERPPRTV